MPLVNHLEYMYGLRRFGIKPGLKNISAVLAALNHPEQKFRSVHITGTNGKGSTAAMVASILQESGLKTGLYTSPHLFAFNERIKINGQNITDQKLVKYIELVRDAATRANTQLTFFEFATAVAFSYFAQETIDIAVVEVGMGGALDATNVINPEVAVITNVSLDHTEILGDTKEKIARDKAGVIKPGGAVITAEEDPGLINIFQEACAQQNAKLHIVQNEIQIKPLEETWHSQTFQACGAISGNYTVPLLGKHQLTNAATALLAAHILSRQIQNNKISQFLNFSISNNIQQGLKNTHWPGRLQVVSQKPFILVDGAHNETGALALKEFAEERQLKFDVLVLGLKQGKDAQKIIRIIAPLARHIITTEGAYQPLSAEELSGLITGSEAIKSVPAAVAQARAQAGEEGKILITGSLYMIPEAMKALAPAFPNS